MRWRLLRLHLSLAPSVRPGVPSLYFHRIIAAAVGLLGNSLHLVIRHKAHKLLVRFLTTVHVQVDSLQVDLNVR